MFKRICKFTSCPTSVRFLLSAVLGFYPTIVVAGPGSADIASSSWPSVSPPAILMRD